MEIRSVTTFFDPAHHVPLPTPFLAAARDAFTYPVQSLRLATTPLPDWWSADVPPTAVAAQAAAWQDAGINYASLGPIQLRHTATWLDHIPTLLSVTDLLFVTAEIADRRGTLSLARCRQVARVMQQTSTLLDNGFGNLYLAAVANCGAGSPFFPVAYHSGGAPAFAVAVESADLALRAIQASRTLDEARQNLVDAIETAAAAITTAAQRLTAEFGLPFGGVDFSLAPFPTDDNSIGGALEALGIPFVGAAGSLFAAAFVTEAIERARFKSCGFSGLMLPVLEDSVLARRAAQGHLSLAALLQLSAVCGVGLDTIPLPGDVSEAQLTAVLLDVAALATRLNKPLTARLMPLPGLQAGDAVAFDFPYFANGGAMPILGNGVSGLIAAGDELSIQPIKTRQSLIS